MTEFETILKSWCYEVAGLPRSGLTLWFEADSQERVDIARFLDLQDLQRFRVEVRISPRKGKVYAVSGHLQALIVQSCVITLEPVEDNLDVTFDRLLIAGDEAGSPESQNSNTREVIFNVDDVDPPDVFNGDEIDIGLISLEELALNLNPYPRHPDAGEWEEEASAADESPTEETADTQNPFVVLQKLKSGRNDQ